MKAVRFSEYGDVDVLEYCEVPNPAPRPNEVLVEVHYASVNPVDWKIRTGLLQAYFHLTLPVILGRDASGVVVEIGSDVKNLRVGDAVCLIATRPEQGTYAELVAIDSDRAVLRPQQVGYREAAAYPSVCVPAWTALMKTAVVRAGMKVLIHGAAGGVGGIAVQLAKHLGAEVTGTCHSKDATYVLGLGAERVVAYDREDFQEVLKKDYDFVFDTVGGKVHRHSYGVLRAGGTLVHLIAEPIEDRSKTFGVQTRLVVEKDHGEVLREVTGLVSKGIIKPQPCHDFHLSETAAAHRLSESGEVRGKIMLQVR